MQFILLLFSIIISTSFFGQQKESTSWVLINKFPIQNNDTWTVDVIGNVYIGRNTTISKFDQKGTLLFSQSDKSLGRVKTLAMINTLKLVSFSEEQQKVCFLDNTLGTTKSCLDLTDSGINNAVMISTSSQSDKLWIYDQQNTQLLLLDIAQTNQRQEIKNLSGILNNRNIQSIQESNNELFLLDDKGSVFHLDRYGSLLELFLFEKCTQIYVQDEKIFLLQDQQITIHEIKTGQQTAIKLPFQRIEEFKIINNIFYFKVDNFIYKHTLQIQG